MPVQTPTDPASLRGLAYFQAAGRLTYSDWGKMLARHSIPANLAAGLTVTLIALPLNLALAIACGLPPSVGLITGAIAGLVGAFFGGSRFAVTGPEIALAPITLEIVSRHGFPGLIAATFLAGLMQVAFGLFRVGGLVHAIPIPVVGGFLAAVGLLVFDAQLPRLLGLPSEIALLSDVRSIDALKHIDLSALILGVLVVAAMVFLPRINKRLPGPLVGLTLAVAAMALFGLDVASVPPIETALPRPSWPAFGSVDLVALVPEALALALLASIDSLLCAVSTDALVGGERTRTDQELCAQGLANMTSACFGGMPVAAAVVRSVAAVQAGATTRLAPMVQSVALGVVLVAAASLVSYVPLVSLAAILLVVGFRLIQWRQLLAMWRMARFEALIFIVTAAGILLSDFVIGVGVGVVAALVDFARQQGAALRAERLRAARLPQDAQPQAADVQVPVIQLEGPLFFGSQASIDSAILNVGASDRVLIDISKVSTVDVSGALAFANALKRLANDGLTVSVSARGNVVEPVLLWSLEQNAHALISLIDAPAPPARRARNGETRPTAKVRVRRHRLPTIPPSAGAYSTAQVERS